MKNIFYCLAILLISCSSPQKAFEKQNYSKAFRQSLKKVKSKKATSKDKDILMESLRQLLSQNDREIEILEQGRPPKDWIKALKYIDDSNEKIRKAAPYTRYDFTQINSRLADKETKITTDIYGFYLRAGKQELDESKQTGEKLKAQKAYGHFNQAKRYTNDPRLMDQLMAECVKYGKVIYSINSDAPFGLGWEVDRAFGNFERESNRFLEVNFDRIISDADCDINIDFRDFDIDYRRRTVEDRQFQEEVEAGYRTETDTSGNEIRIPIYETVFGQVRVEELSKIAIGEIWINVYSNNKNCRLSDKRIENEIVNVVERHTITGDRRAIPNNYDDTFQDELMQDDDIAEELIDLLYEEIRNYIF